MSTEKFHVIKINREKGMSPANTLKIDDKFINGITNVKIAYGINEPYPLVTIELLAKKLIMKVKSKDIKMIKEIL